MNFIKTQISIMKELIIRRKSRIMRFKIIVFNEILNKNND